MAKLLCRFAALCSVWIHTTGAVLRDVRPNLQAWPESEGGGWPDGSGGVPEPGDDAVVPVEGDTGNEGGGLPDGSGGIPEPGDDAVVPVEGNTEDEVGGLPDGSGGIPEPGGDAVVPVKGNTTEGSEWELLIPKFTPEQFSALTRNTNGKANLCLDGRFVPEVLIVGAMASATASFNVALSYSPSVVWPHRSDRRVWQPMSVPGDQAPKEPLDSELVDDIGPNQGAGDGWNYGQGHFFDMMYDVGRQSMGEAYPPCTRTKRIVAVDSTSRYGLDPLVPSNILSWYGVALGSRLKLVYILREPLERLHAHYWKAKNGRWCKRLPTLGFASFVRRLLTGQDQWFRPKPPTRVNDPAQYIDHRCDEILGASLYTSHFSEWFRAFETSQFTIIPFKHVAMSHTEHSLAAENLWKMLGVNGLTPPIVHANAGPEAYPALDEELDQQLQTQFWTLFRKYMGAREVAESLADTDANLYGFSGPRTVENVRHWLLANW